jgi:hypothetical protein
MAASAACFAMGGTPGCMLITSKEASNVSALFIWADAADADGGEIASSDFESSLAN